MGIFEDYKLYQKYEPQYEQWKHNKDLSEAKRLEYLNQNPINESTKQKEVQRAKALLHAIDVMDEYSQSRAENMEVATQQAIALSSQTASYAGLGLGFLLNFLPPVKKLLHSISAKYPKVPFPMMLILPFGASIATSMLTSMGLQAWASSKEVGASRNGRFEAMKKELADVKNFAVLNDEQAAKQNELVKKIPTTKDMKKGIVADKSNMLNPKNIFKTVKSMLINDKKTQKEREDFDKKLYENPKGDIKLSETDIIKAKKDQQLLHNVIEKIDTSSQAYAERVELATQTVIGAALAGGGIVGWLSSKIINLLKVSNIYARKGIPTAVGAIIAIGTSIWAAQIQKQASRVGRYIAKKDLEKNLNNFVYVDENKSDKISNNINIKKEKEPNIFSFIIQAFKNNFEYKKYLKTKGVELIKQNMALKDINLTEEQIKEAKTLQKNTFKAFNKIDEKSQKYAESVEAVGEVIKVPVVSASSLAGLGIGSWIGKILEHRKLLPPALDVLPMFVGILLGLIPGIWLNTIFTKKQIQASKVAHMLALDEMKDYKNYVDYDNLSNQTTINTQPNNTVSMAEFLKKTKLS